MYVCSWDWESPGTRLCPHASVYVYIYYSWCDKRAEIQECVSFIRASSWADSNYSWNVYLNCLLGCILHSQSTNLSSYQPTCVHILWTQVEEGAYKATNFKGCRKGVLGGGVWNTYTLSPKLSITTLLQCTGYLYMIQTLLSDNPIVIYNTVVPCTWLQI